MDLPIKNIDDLRSEIYRLKGIEKAQSVALAYRFRSPSAMLATVMTLFPKTANADGSKKPGFFDQDMVGLLSRLVLPLTLNKTLFRHSNFIVKTLVGLASQKASHFITEDSVTGVWDKAKSVFSGLFKKTKAQEEHHENLPVKVTPAM